MNRPKYQQNYFPHWTNIPVRFRDLDPLNHVNNAIFSTYYEEARINFIRDVPTFAEQMKKNFSFVLANIEIDFINPVEYPADLLIGSGIKKMGNSSITSFQAIYTKKEKMLASVAQAHGVWFDLSTQRPTHLPKITDKDQFILPERFFD
jgi:acyl-CoA thioester hydrolase